MRYNRLTDLGLTVHVGVGTDAIESVQHADGSVNRFNCVPLDDSRLLVAFLLMIAVGVLVLPSVTSMSLGEYPAHHLRRWSFLAAKIALVLTIIGVGVAFGVEYLGYAEFSEVQEVLRRAAARKRLIANNVEVRHAIEALNSCADINAACKILKNSLQFVGFDGLRIGHSLTHVFSDIDGVPLELTTNGEKVAWSIADYLRSMEKGVGELIDGGK